MSHRPRSSAFDETRERLGEWYSEPTTCRRTFNRNSPELTAQDEPKEAFDDNVEQR